tara:strand:+ start:725 stop:1540 length:816 start_codon:yes stop_codon:yes gene_type:complete
MLIPRLISSIVVLPTVIILTWLGEIYFASLIGITVGIATYELSIMLRKRNLIAYPIASGILSSSYILLAYILSIEGNPSIVISLIFILLGISSILYLRFKNPTGNKFVQQILSLIMPAFFTSGFLSHAIFIRNYEEGLSWMFILIIIISLNDIGAFIFGKLIGKIPFFPNISPNKTFEGSLSGIFLGTLGGLTYKFLTGDPEISMPTIFMLSIALTIFGQMGDLFESGMKRLSGIKDSGNIIPGHGGVMDRQDSFVFAIPVLYYFIQWKAI